MIESSFWFDEAARYQEQALETEESEEQREFLELAEACFAFASWVEDRATGG